MWERETCREEKVKKGSSTTHEWKDKKTGDVFIVSWILSFKAISFYIIKFFFFHFCQKRKIFPYYNNFPTQTSLHIITFFFPTALITYSACLDSTESRIHVLRFHARLDSTKSCIHALIIGSTILFIYLKIILLQCFQFSVSATISSIQTHS